jgi:uncharacterized protein
MGEELTVADMMEGGLIEDRAYALIDNSTGKIASAKNPRKWAGLFDCHASFGAPPRKGHPLPPVWIVLPDGSNITSDQPNANEILSRFFERDVTLAKTAPESPALEEYWPDIDGLAHRETVTDESIALSRPRVAFSTMRWLTYSRPTRSIDCGNSIRKVVLKPEDSAPTWVGQNVEIGDVLVLKVTNPCPRCVMTTLAQADLPQDHGILRTAAQHNQPFVPALGSAMPSVGVYANVLRAGVISRNDPIHCNRQLPLPK